MNAFVVTCAFVTDNGEERVEVLGVFSSASLASAAADRWEAAGKFAEFSPTYEILPFALDAA